VVFKVLFYVATAILVGGLAYRIRIYAKTPAPLKIPTTPAPTTRSGVAMRLVREVTVFESLFRSNKWIWLFGWMFHFALLLAFFRHLRYGMSPDNPLFVLVSFELVQSVGRFGGYAMLLGLLGLLARRIVVDRVRYISSPSDFLMLLLLLAIAGSGMLMSFIPEFHTDIVGLKAFIMGLIYFDWQPLPEDPVLMVHLGLVAALMIIFPVSKLLHAPGVFFSPTRNQVDNPREHRHVSSWAVKLETTSGQ